MKISDPGAFRVNPYIPTPFVHKQDEIISPESDSKNRKISSPSSAWQKDILMQAVEKLENNIQTDDSHPLDKKGAAPIESYNEAVIELSLFKNNFDAEQASGAQANISPESILSLFTDESEI